VTRDGGSAFQHIGPETAKAREPNVTVLVSGKSRSPWIAARKYLLGQQFVIISFVSETGNRFHEE